MDQEEVYAEEAQEEAASRSQHSPDSRHGGKVSSRTDVAEYSSDNESSPLINQRPQRPGYSERAGHSYDRAIKEPWTGAYGVGPLPWHKKPSIYWLLPAFFPFCLAFGGILVPKQYLILDLVCRDYLSERASHDPTYHFMPVILGDKNPQCRIPEVQSLVAKFNLYQNLLSGIFAAVMSPQLGALSDRIGRKPIMLYASLGLFCMEIITIIVGKNPETVSVYWILLGSLLDGLSGSFTTGMALSFAYASDCTPPERRNTAFGYFHGTLFAGVALGPIMAGFFMKLTGTVMIAFYIALGCHVFFMSFILFLIPESLSKERQVLAKEKHEAARKEASGWWTTLRNYNLLEPLWVLRPKGPGTSPELRRNLLILASIDTLMFGVAMGTMNIILIYVQYRFGWDEFGSSLYLSAVNVCRVAGLIGLLPLLTRIFRGRVAESGHRGSDKLDIGVIRGTIVLDLVGYIGYALTPNGAIMVISGLVASLGGMGSPTLQSSLTKHMPADRTGQVLGASALLHALARVFFPLIFNLIYSKTVGMYAGFVFLCLSSVFVVVFILSWFVKPNGKSNSTCHSVTTKDSTVYLKEVSEHDSHEDRLQVE